MSSSTVELVVTDRLECRRLEPGDADVLRAIMFEPTVLEWLAPGESPSEADFQEALADSIRHWDAHGFGFWLACDLRTGEPVGRGGLRWTDACGQREVEAAWVIIPSRRGQGLATELAGAAVRTALGPLGLEELIAYTLADNVASRRVMEKAGFAYDRDIVVDQLPHVLYRLGRVTAAG